MSNERFEELAYNVGISLDGEKAIMSSDDYDFLYNYALEQAERLEAIIKHRNDILKANEYLNEQNKRYKQALEEILKINEKHEWNLYGLAYAMAERALLNEAPEQENDK